MDQVTCSGYHFTITQNPAKNGVHCPSGGSDKVLF